MKMFTLWCSGKIEYIIWCHDITEKRLFVGSRACAANHYVIAEKCPYKCPHLRPIVGIARRCRFTRDHYIFREMSWNC